MNIYVILGIGFSLFIIVLIILTIKGIKIERKRRYKLIKKQANLEFDNLKKHYIRFNANGSCKINCPFKIKKVGIGSMECFKCNHHQNHGKDDHGEWLICPAYKRHLNENLDHINQNIQKI